MQDGAHYLHETWQDILMISAEKDSDIICRNFIFLVKLLKTLKSIMPKFQGRAPLAPRYQRPWTL